MLRLLSIWILSTLSFHRISLQKPIFPIQIKLHSIKPNKLFNYLQPVIILSKQKTATSNGKTFFLPIKNSFFIQLKKNLKYLNKFFFFARYVSVCSWIFVRIDINYLQIVVQFMCQKIAILVRYWRVIYGRKSLIEKLAPCIKRYQEFLLNL